ncbi:MAG: sugar transferase, partial [Anaerolineae bacterium]
REVESIVRASALGFLMLSGVLYLTFRQTSRLQMIYFGALALLLIVALRIAVRGFFKVVGGRRMDARHVLIIGTGEMARDIGEAINAYAWAGLYLVGYAGSLKQAVDPLPAPILGSMSQVEHIVKQYNISEVVIALPFRSQMNLPNLVRDLQMLPLNIRLVPDYFDLAFLDVHVEDFGGMPLLALKEPTLTPFQRLGKRMFDLIVVSIGLLFSLPFMALIALIIKLDSPGPILYKQDRIGEGGKPFKMLKFRTMVTDADKIAELIAKRREDGKVLHKHPDDPRVTRVGRLLRRTSLDELPQLFNILRGEMSLVGPRPEMPWLVKEYEPWQHNRFHVPQGLTGWWQINGRSDKPMHLHTEEDLFYIRNYSLWLDIQILWRTIGVVISGRGAY